MTIDQIIDGLLRRIFRDHYGPERVREFARDRSELIRAIARYGHACASRGWYFEEAAIFGELGRVIDTFRDKRDAIEYLPSYLRGAVDRHIGMQAERLSEQAKTSAATTERFRRCYLASGPAKVVVERPPVEILSDLYRDLGRRARERRRERSASAKASKSQLSLI